MRIVYYRATEITEENGGFNSGPLRIGRYSLPSSTRRSLITAFDDPALLCELCDSVVKISLHIDDAFPRDSAVNSLVLTFVTFVCFCSYLSVCSGVTVQTESFRIGRSLRVFEQKAATETKNSGAVNAEIGPQRAAIRTRLRCYEPPFPLLAFSSLPSFPSVQTSVFHR
jgi:hypothetical protein